jgi:hypothetical protein
MFPEYGIRWKGRGPEPFDFCGEEWIENGFYGLFIHTTTVISNLNLDPLVLELKFADIVIVPSSINGFSLHSSTDSRPPGEAAAGQFQYMHLKQCLNYLDPLID